MLIFLKVKNLLVLNIIFCNIINNKLNNKQNKKNSINNMM